MPMRQITARTPDGADIAVTIEGQGPALLLVTGLGGTARFWAPAAARLAATHTVISFDHRAVGASTRGSAPVSVGLLADDCIAVLDAAGFGRTILLGHSLGGAIGQAFAHRHGERLTGLVLSATWMTPNRFIAELFDARRKLLLADPAGYAALAAIMGYSPGWLAANWPVLDAAVAAAPLSPPQQAAVAERIAALLAFDGRPLLGAYDGPTLVQGVSDDMIVPAFLQQELAAAIPHAEALEFPDGGHLFPVSRTEAFVTTLAAWIYANVPPA
jgi:aminoacrylate hydrolase